MTDTRSGKKETGGTDPVEAFLAAAEAFVRNVSAAQVKAAGKHPDAILVDGMARIVTAQFGRACEEIRALHRDSGPAVRREAEAVVARQGGNVLPAIGEEVALAAIAAGPGGGFFGWLSDHLGLIKKILRLLIQIGHGGVMPPWWEKTLEIIDEPWNGKNALSAGIGGFNRAEIAHEISARHVGMMNELAAVARLVAAERQGAADNGD
jgi:hypothetical protein